MRFSASIALVSVALMFGIPSGAEAFSFSAGIRPSALLTPAKGVKGFKTSKGWNEKGGKCKRLAQKMRS